MARSLRSNGFEMSQDGIAKMVREVEKKKRRREGVRERERKERGEEKRSALWAGSRTCLADTCPVLLTALFHSSFSSFSCPQFCFFFLQLLSDPEMRRSVLDDASAAAARARQVAKRGGELKAKVAAAAAEKAAGEKEKAEEKKE